MKTVDISAIRSVSVSEMFDGPAEPAKSVLCKFRYNADELTAMNDSLTLILNRDIRSSMEHASEVSVFLAKKFPERTVLLVNTYAGESFMRETLVKGMVSSQVPLPSRLRYSGLPDGIEFAAAGDGEVLTNLRLMNCPLATLDAARLEGEVKAHGCDIVVLNSFEFSSLNRFALWNLARGIVELREKLDLSMIVYSQQFRASISPYFIGRGAIGMMAPYADSVWKVYSDFESVHISHKNMTKIAELDNEEPNQVH